jgi:cell division septation protein DedD
MAANTAPADTSAVHSLETPAALPTSVQAFAVQLGSFANRSNADKLVHRLKGQGFAIYMNEEGSGAATRYRVRVGPLADRDAAERMIVKLKGVGQAATIVSAR